MKQLSLLLSIMHETLAVNGSLYSSTHYTTLALQCIALHHVITIGSSATPPPLSSYQNAFCRERFDNGRCFCTQGILFSSFLPHATVKYPSHHLPQWTAGKDGKTWTLLIDFQLLCTWLGLQVSRDKLLDTKKKRKKSIFQGRWNRKGPRAIWNIWWIF